MNILFTSMGSFKMTTQENNKVSNFSEISTYKYDRFNEMVLSQLEQIIINFTNLPRVQALIQFYDTVDKHIFHEPKAHGFSINPYKSELINQLYQVYLNFGYTGDVKQMLFSFIKNIEIATHEDINYGWDKTKALPLSDGILCLKNMTKIQKHIKRYMTYLTNMVLSV